MGLSGEEEHHRTLRVVHNLRQTVEIGEQQVGTLIGSKASAEADDQRIGIEALRQLGDTAGIVLILQPRSI